MAPRAHTRRTSSSAEFGEAIPRVDVADPAWRWYLEEFAAQLFDQHTAHRPVLAPEGFVFIVDRLKDMIISGGENVYSAEVENAISVMPGVAEVAVIGVPDATWGESVHAVVVPRAGADLTAEAVIAHCRAQIAGYKCPRSVEFRDMPLPLSGAGKVLKRELREPFWKADQKAGVLNQ